MTDLSDNKAQNPGYAWNGRRIRRRFERRNEANMVDVSARLKFAELLRHFVSGRLSNFEYEKRAPDSKDGVIRAIDHCVWCFYDDFKEHKINRKLDFDQATRNAIGRWIVFLHTTEEYEWPAISCPGLRPMRIGLISKLFKKDIEQRRFMEYGEYNYWPFINQMSYENAIKSPLLLSGS